MLNLKNEIDRNKINSKVFKRIQIKDKIQVKEE